MSAESLIYEPYPELVLVDSNTEVFIGFLRRFKEVLAYETRRGALFRLTKEFITGGPTAHQGLFDRINNKFIQTPAGGRFAELSGLLFPATEEACKACGFTFSSRSDSATYEVENLWLASRITPDDTNVNHVIVTLAQKRGVKARVDENGDFHVTGYFAPDGPVPGDGFIFRGGCTLIFDLDEMKLKYAIRKGVDDQARMELQYRYINDIDGAKGEVYFGNNMLAQLSGPFAFMHSFNHQH